MILAKSWEDIKISFKDQIEDELFEGRRLISKQADISKPETKGVHELNQLKYNHKPMSVEEIDKALSNYKYFTVDFDPD
jgi:hypothetical protein